MCTLKLETSVSYRISGCLIYVLVWHYLCSVSPVVNQIQVETQTPPLFTLRWQTKWQYSRSNKATSNHGYTSGGHCTNSVTEQVKPFQHFQYDLFTFTLSWKDYFSILEKVRRFVFLSVASINRVLLYPKIKLCIQI